MMEAWELERIRAILRKEATGFASVSEQEELRTLINNHTGKAMSLPWHALLEVAQYVSRIYLEDEGVAETA